MQESIFLLFFLFLFSKKKLVLGGTLLDGHFPIHYVMVIEQYAHRLAKNTEKTPEKHIAHLA